MGVVTLATLRTRSRVRADMLTPGFVADDATGIDAWINEGVQMLHEKLVAAYGSNYVSKIANLVVSGSGFTSLPSDFLSLLGATLPNGNNPITMRPFAQTERDQNTNTNALPWNGSRTNAPRYQLFAGNIRIRPNPPANTPLTLEYSPVATLLVGTGDAVDFPNGWERYVVVYTAIQMRIKQESSVTELNALLEKMDKDLKEMADLRDAGAPAVAADVDPDSEV